MTDVSKTPDEIDDNTNDDGGPPLPDDFVTDDPYDQPDDDPTLVIISEISDTVATLTEKTDTLIAAIRTLSDTVHSQGFNQNAIDTLTAHLRSQVTDALRSSDDANISAAIKDYTKDVTEQRNDIAALLARFDDVAKVQVAVNKTAKQAIQSSRRITATNLAIAAAAFVAGTVIAAIFIAAFSQPTTCTSPPILLSDGRQACMID